jgi:hypothetical protein
MNGSSPKTLIADIVKALHALTAAIKAVAETAPHPRDWQTAKDGDALFNVARDQHRARLHRLYEIHDELQEIGLAIQDQADARSAR